jgi:acid phosphatase
MMQWPMRRVICFAALVTVSVIAALPASAQNVSPPHIMLILMENHGAGSIIGNSAAPFQNSLASRYITLTNWTGVDHPSAPNYVALTTGQDNGKAGRNDCTPSYPKVTPCDFVGNNLGVQFAAAGIPARWYAEGLVQNGCSINNAESGQGDINHEPWAYLPTWQANRTACAEAGLTTTAPHDPEVLTALKSARPPDFVWLTPNLQDDTHSGGIAQGDRYLKALITAVQGTSWYATGGTIIVTYDEDEGETNPSGYCTNPVIINAIGPHCVPTFIVSRADTGVGKVPIPGDHYGMLRSIEEAYGLPLLREAATSKYGDISRYLP